MEVFVGYEIENVFDWTDFSDKVPKVVKVFKDYKDVLAWVKSKDVWSVHRYYEGFKLE
jgi:hypothetical protein